MDAEKAAVSIDALLERGNNFLLEEQFDQAHAYFNKVLDADAKNVKAYWGLVLAEHQCKDELTLLDRGVPVDHDTNFGYVMKYADDNEAVYYRAIRDVLHVTCHLCFMNVARTGNVFVMKKWAAHYTACDPNGPFAFYHQFFIRNGGLTVTAELPGALLSLYGVYTDALLSMDIAQQLKPALTTLAEESKKKIADDYTKCMNELLGNTVSSRNVSTISQNAAMWALPAAEFVKQYQRPITAPAGLDGYPDRMADRYMALVEAFEKRGFGPMVVKRHLHTFVDIAEQNGFDPAACAAMREKLLVQILTDQQISMDDLNFVISRHPNDFRPRWQQLMLMTNNLSAFGQDNTPDKTYDRFMNIPAVSRSESQEQEIIAYLQKQRQDLLDFRAQAVANATPCLNAAMAGAGSQAADMQTKWNAYIAKLDFVTNERVARCDQRLAAATAHIAETNRKETAKANRNSVVKALLSLLITATAVPAIWYVLGKFNDPLSIIRSFNRGWFYVIGMVAAVVAGVVTFVLTANCAPKKTRFRGIGLMNVIRSVTPALCIVGYLGAVGLLIASAVTFAGKVGTVAIKDVDDLVYLSHYSSGDFVLEADLDLDGKALEKLGKFKGTLDGADHKISNFKVEKGYWITKQNGTIQNLTLEKATLKNALFKTNNGTLNGVTVTEATVKKTREKTATHSAILMHINNGDVISCAIKDSTFTFTYGYMVDGYIGGIAAKSSGRIVASYVNGTTIEGSYVMNADSGMPYIYAGTIVGHDTSEDGLLGCHSNATLKLDMIDELYDPDGMTTKYPRATTMIGGLAGGGKAEQSYFKGTLAINSAFIEGDHHRTSYIDNHFYIGGLLGSGEVKNSYSNCTIDAHFLDENNAYDPADTQEFVGGLVGYINTYSIPSAENCYAKVACTFEAHSGNYDYAPLIGYSRSEANPALKNCFNYGTQKITGSKGTITYSGRIASENIYYSKSMFPNENGDKYVSNSKIKTKSFVTKTLGWDTEIWKVTDDKLPTLKPYVVEEATDAAKKED